MIKVKKIYICDHCNNLALYETYPDGSECLPAGWKRFKNQTKGENDDR